MNKKTYIGDSVYAEIGDFAITLTTENGHGATNTIVLEPEVLRALVSFLTSNGVAHYETPPSPSLAPLPTPPLVA
jgi:hypothetical protein